MNLVNLEKKCPKTECQAVRSGFMRWSAGTSKNGQSNRYWWSFNVPNPVLGTFTAFNIG